MKVLIYSEGLKYIYMSGLGRAIKHQMKALELNNIDYTCDPKDSYDIIHINTTGLNSYRLAKKAKKQGKKVVYHAHSTEEDFKNSFVFSTALSPLFKKWIILLYNTADHIVTPTPYSKKLLESYGISIPISSVSNGINLDSFKNNQAHAELFRKKYGFSKTDKIVLAVGLYFERKGILDFVELAKRMPEYQFVWCGYTNPLLIPRKIKRVLNNHPDNVHFLGYLEGDMIKGAFSATDVFVMLSYEETEGIVVLEALASKQNVIVRDIDVYNPWLVDKINCYKATNNNEFEAIIKRIIHKEADDLTGSGYQIVQERSLLKIGKELKSVYTSLLGNKNDN